MNSFYDNELIVCLNDSEIERFLVISDTSDYIDKINSNFNFLNGRINFIELNNNRYMGSNQNNISTDIVCFINGLIQDGLCEKNERIIYIGDSLINNGYEFYLYDLIKILPYLVNEIPQHHYFFSINEMKIIFVSFENEIYFGIL